MPFSSSRLLAFSTTLYRLLLYVYPREFRQFYQQEMLLTFRDCCLEQQERAGTWGIMRLWGFVLLDLAIAAGREHYQTVITIFQMLVNINTAKEYAMSSQLLHLNVGAQTDRGLTRAANEDNVVAVVPSDPQTRSSKGALFIAADGLGGYTRGDVASEMATRIINETYYQQAGETEYVLRTAVERANRAIYESNQQQGMADKKTEMGTTCVAAVLLADKVYIANVGDSLAYLIRGEHMRQIAEDHSWVAEQVRTGQMSLDEARAQGKNNLITRCLGIKENEQVYIGVEQVQDGDILVLCTDGLHMHISEDELRAIVEQHEPAESVTRLIARVNEQGSPDNITAVVVRITLEQA